MYTYRTICIILVFALCPFSHAQKNPDQINNDTISAFKSLLTDLAEETPDDFFKLHCQSIIDVINSKITLTKADSAFLTETYKVFKDRSDSSNPSELEPYLSRERSFTLAWESPTDGEVSFAWLKLPIDWDMNNKYPLYIQLHGYWNVAASKIDYLTYPYLQDPSTTYAFEDGYYLAPWGRGNLWYQGISETDIWECIEVFEDLAEVDEAKKYICGHSMGGYGAWNFGHTSVNTWAAIGIHAGALSYDGDELATTEEANTLKDTPVYFVCGTKDYLYNVNQIVYNLLTDAGNKEVSFVAFEGGHEYRQVDVEAMYDWMRQFRNTGPNSISEEQFMPLSQSLDLKMKPNPFQVSVEINYYLSQPENVKVIVVNNLGQTVEILANEYQSAGEYRIIWTPEGKSPGLYHCQIIAGNSYISEPLFMMP